MNRRLKLQKSKNAHIVAISPGKEEPVNVDPRRTKTRTVKKPMRYQD